MNIDHKCKNSFGCFLTTVCKQIETDSFYLSNHKQAEIYWQWLRNKYMRNEKRKYKNVFLKLPTNNPWIYAAEGGLEAEFPFKNNKLSNKKGEYQTAFRIIQQEEIKTENGQCSIIAKIMEKFSGKTSVGLIIVMISLLLSFHIHPTISNSTT